MCNRLPVPQTKKPRLAAAQPRCETPAVPTAVLLPQPLPAMLDHGRCSRNQRGAISGPFLFVEELRTFDSRRILPEPIGEEKAGHSGRFAGFLVAVSRYRAYGNIMSVTGSR